MKIRICIIVSMLAIGEVTSVDHYQQLPVLADQMGRSPRPRDLKSALEQLDISIGPEIKAEMKALPSREEMIRYQHSIGTWIRNDWLLWKRGRSQRYFKARGITDTEEMSMIILQHYYDRLHGDMVSWLKWEALHPKKGM